MKRLRIVQWATGNVGSRSLRTVIEHPRMELAGVLVHTAAKDGVDAGTLCGLPPVGVAATRNVDEIIALDADCVLYMPYQLDADDLVRLLEAGTDVVTTKQDFQNPELVEPVLRARLEIACAHGESSIYSTGSSPGIVTDALPVTLLSFLRRLDGLTLDEYSDVAERASPNIVFGAMGFGRRPEDADVAALTENLKRSRERSFHMLADAFGTPLDDVETHAEIALARSRTEIAAGVVEPGTVAGTRLSVSGMRAGRPILTFRTNWFCTRDLDTDWELIKSGWRFQVDGDVPLDVRIDFPIPAEEYAATTPGLTAHPAVNAVPAVCAAPPGILRSIDLPQILPIFG
ncbi:4-hydroxy-tetrahydrodipicolinate reductase [Prauserella sediminis]|uniref:4-hydroxy-tetrahydrodipicolinate reductase n=1 Tax=Prauserella sediminis TaxID=577680 RepID=A0A839XQR9_9PSEU|nr:dihydrodipicolinate reductase [Prauserella sediminis]MBB3665560.1 4-hydroxy-tetrahydrodipicolinate reductase [Prauserella sediminis]